MRIFTTALLIASAAPSLHAQVGVPPERSPYRDIEYRMELGAQVGYYNAGKDVAGVAPHSAPYVGAHYNAGFGGLVSLTARAGIVPTKRTVIDPTRAAGSRVIGEESHMLVLADAGLTFDIIGARTFHGFAPSVTVGLGSVTALQSQDLGGYSHGSRMKVNVGGGIRYAASPDWHLRLDVTNHIYSIRYPGKYREPSTDGSAVITGGSSRIHNLVVSVGLVRRFFR